MFLAGAGCSEALKRYEEALEILKNIGLVDSQDADILKDNIKSIKET